MPLILKGVCVNNGIKLEKPQPCMNCSWFGRGSQEYLNVQYWLEWAVGPSIQCLSFKIALIYVFQTALTVL